MNFLVVSPERAERIKARWWAAARLELKLWVFIFFCSSVLLGAFLAPPVGFLIVGLIEAILISRIALWVTVICAAVAWIMGSAAAAIGYSLYTPEPITAAMVLCTVAILIRFALWAFFYNPRYGRKIA